MSLYGPRSRPNPHFKLWKCQESNPRHHGQKDRYTDPWINEAMIVVVVAVVAVVLQVLLVSCV